MSDQRPSQSFPRAFVAAPDPSRYFPAAVIEETRQRLIRSIERGEGPALVIGAAGTGKTLLLEVLAAQYSKQRCTVTLAGAQLCSRRALLQMILFQVGLPFRDLDEGELRLSLMSYLKPQGEPAHSLLLLVDEAESLPVRLLEELRVLTNVSDSGQLLVNLVLFGSANLEERFAEPKLEVFSQRISSRSYLTSLSREETFQYIRSQIAAVGAAPDELFTADGLEAMHAATDGIPRLVNQLGDQLLWMASETGYAPLDGAIVQQAWSELQQLPAPWNQETQEVSSAAVEFGELDGNDYIVDDLNEMPTEEELPASIPISSSNASVSASLETIDITEQLIEQLDQMESGKPTVAAEVSNPFAEVFELEEVVLDRYTEIESQLLNHSQRVFNQLDAAFSQQLKQCEVISKISVVKETSSPLIVEEPEVVVQEVKVQPEPSLELPEESIAAEPEEIDDDAIISNESTELEIPGELLVVEDERSSKAAVVPGGKYRQLFSSLESGATPVQFG